MEPGQVTIAVTFMNQYGAYATWGSVQFSSSDPQAVLPPDYTISTATTNPTNFTVTLLTAGVQTVTAYGTGPNGAFSGSVSVNVIPGPAASLVVAGIPSPYVADNSSDVIVTALDAYGNVSAGYCGTIHFSSSDPSATLPADYTFLPTDRGVHTFSSVWVGTPPIFHPALVLETPSDQSVTVTDTSAPGGGYWCDNAADPNGIYSSDWIPGGLTGTESGIDVTAASTDVLSVSGIPSQVAAGVPQTVTVAARNGSTTLTGYTGTIKFTSSDGAAVLPANYTFLPSDNGVHTFSITLNTPGPQSVTATDTGTSSITGTQSGIEVVGKATSLVFTGLPKTTVAGIGHTVTVTAVDQYGYPDTTYRGTIHFTTSDRLAYLPGDKDNDYTFTGTDAGVHTFTNSCSFTVCTGGVTLKRVGTQTVIVTDTTTSSITGRQAGIVVTPSSTTHFVVSGIPSPVLAGTAENLTVTAKDAYGNTATGYTGTIKFTSTDSAAVLPANYTYQANEGGVHTFNVTLNTAGTQQVQVIDTGNSSFGGSETGIVVTPGAATHFVVTGIPSPTVPGAADNVTVTAKDAYGNTAFGYAGIVHFTSSDSAAVLPANATLTAGVGTFSVTFNTAGTQSLTATDTVTSSITGSETGIVVAGAGYTPVGTGVGVIPAFAGSPNPVTLTFDDVTTAGFTSLTAGSTPLEALTGGYQVGSPATYYDLTTTALFTGSVTVCFAYGGVSPAPTSVLQYVGGSWTDVTVRPIDTADQLICGTASSLSPFDLVTGPLAKITVSPPSPTVTVGATQQFAAAGADTYGGVVSITPTWSVSTTDGGTGSITQAGLYSALTVGSTTVEATVGSVTGSAAVSNVAAVVSSVLCNPVAGGSPIAIGGQVSCTYTAGTGSTFTGWTASGFTVDSASSLTNNPVIFDAGTTAGSASISAAFSEGSLDATPSPIVSTFTIGASTLATITVSPPSPTVTIGVPQQFKATGADAYGNPVTITPTWSVTPGTGSGGISSSTGLYAAQSVGTTTVVATVGAVTGQAAVTNVAVASTVLCNPVTGSTVIAGTSVSCTYTPGSLSIFTGWTAKGFTPLSSTGNPATFVATTAGAASISAVFTPGAADPTSSPITSTFTITASPLAKITVTPSSATVTIGVPQQFSAAGFDASGNSVTITPTWSVASGTPGTGTISSSGLYSALTTGTTTVYAMASGVTGAAAVTNVKPVPVLTYTGPTTAAPGAAITLSATLRTSGGAGISGATLTFTLNSVIHTATTYGSGTATWATTAPTTTGTYPISVAFAGNTTYAAAPVATANLVVALPVPVLTYTGPTSAAPGAAITLSATLRTSGGAPVAGRTVTFTLDSGTPSAATTNSFGVASVKTTAPTPTGSHTISVKFAGDSTYGPASTSATLTVQIATTLTYTGPTSAAPGASITLSVILKSTAGALIANETITITFNGATLTEMTNSSGVASVGVKAPSRDGTYTIGLAFAGDSTHGYGPASTSVSLRVH
jgi:hypothetical protein